MYLGSHNATRCFWRPGSSPVGCSSNSSSECSRIFSITQLSVPSSYDVTSNVPCRHSYASPSLFNLLSVRVHLFQPVTLQSGSQRGTLSSHKQVSLRTLASPVTERPSRLSSPKSGNLNCNRQSASPVPNATTPQFVLDQ